MFSFHKPKIYRSSSGCCICKAKSSSSRFTDSNKYEDEFERCFRIKEKRSGEICNACVLLVKRWKKLSPESRLTKHWHHVVDARAGPGTKLTGNRRIVNPQAGTSQTPTSSKGQQRPSNKFDVLPLSSSQANNQSGQGTSRARTNSLSKAKAIDTNVSTFTFGEPISAYRRNYMTSEPSSYSTYSSLSPMSTSNSFFHSRPQSALNSSAFESVIKRFRQRQQQQLIETQRRQHNRQQKLLARQEQQQDGSEKSFDYSRDQTSSTHKLVPTSSDQKSQALGSDANMKLPSQSKRVKRLSENSSSLASYESLMVSSVLDSSIWRKEKICCGTIFRGLYNEVAIFPKLLRPCECRLGALRKNGNEEDIEDGQASVSKGDKTDGTRLKTDISEPESPPPRATKSGSISSSTSGTGSMEQPTEDDRRIKQTGGKCSSLSKGKSVAAVARPRSMPSKKRWQQQKRQDKESDNSNPESGSSEVSSKESASVDSPSSATSSDNSSKLALMIDAEHLIRGEHDEEEDELVMAVDDVLESSNDDSSSAESLVGISGKNSSALAMG